MDIAVDPGMLRWVRERAGLQVDELARKVGVRPKRVHDWEVYGQLTVKQAEEVAKATHAPFGYLYLDQPPEETLPITDFRTIGSKRVVTPSLELRETIDIALARQAWYRENAIANGFEPLTFVGSLSGSEAVDAAARLIRERFAFQPDRSPSQTWEDTLDLQRERLESQGVLVMRSGFVGEGNNRPLQIKEFRGFELADNYAPLLFVNGQDPKAAQMFTLMHELVHLWLGLSGVSNLNRTYAYGPSVESFCNGVAAEILVPAHELRVQVQINDDTTALAVFFKVSRLVILRRLRDIGLMAGREFVKLYRKTLSRLNQELEVSENPQRGGDYYRTKINRLGKPFISALLESALEGRTAPTEAFYLLGVGDFTKLRRLAEEMKFANF